MNLFRAYELTRTLELLHVQQTACDLRRIKEKGSEFPTEEFLKTIAFNLSELMALCESHGFAYSKSKIAASLRQLDHSPGSYGRMDFSSIATELRNVAEAVSSDLDSRSFLYIANDLEKLVDNEHSMGVVVVRSFPSAEHDVVEAGNCLAADCNTAAVFHLMRVAEYGLRALARDRRISLPKKGVIDLAGWDDIIRQLEQAEKEIQNYPKTLARDAQFDFYHGAMMQFRRFKNAFRNKVMHARKDFDFDSPAALAVFGHVREFMQTLSRHISEAKRTPKIWKGQNWVS